MRLPNGFGSVVNLGKRRRKPFGVRITTGWNENKRQTYKYLGYFEKKIDALAFLMEYNKNPHQIEAQKITLKEAYDKWSDRHFQKVSENSIKSYKYSFKKCAHLYDVPFHELRTIHFQDIVDELETTSTARTFKNVIKMVYEYGMKHEIVNKDYSEYIEIPKGKTKRVQTPYTLEEINTLWEKQGSEVADILLILLYSGMRISELLNMKVGDVHFENRYMVGGTKTKAGINRVIPLHRKIAPLIEARLNNKQYLFESRVGGAIHYSRILLNAQKFFEELGFKHTIHETRHTFISQADRLPINKNTLKRIVGHSSKQDVTNDVYTHKTIDDVIEAIDLFTY